MSYPIIMAAASMETSQKTLCEIMQGRPLRIDWERFNDGFPKLFIHQAELIQNRAVIFLADLSLRENLFDQFAVMSALRSFKCSSLDVWIPYFPTGTMDRVTRYGEIATAKSLARMLENIPSTKGGLTTLHIMDIHALQEQFFFNDDVIVSLESALPCALPGIAFSIDAQNLAVVFPDDGARKRYANMVGTYPQIVCAKVRQGDKRVVTIDEGNPQGKDCLIIDDLSRTGGTLIECAKVLHSAGAKSVSVFITHAVFEEGVREKFTPDLFKNVCVTNSVPHVTQTLNTNPMFKVYDYATLFSVEKWK